MDVLPAPKYSPKPWRFTRKRRRSVAEGVESEGKNLVEIDMNWKGVGGGGGVVYFEISQKWYLKHNMKKSCMLVGWNISMGAILFLIK